MVLHLYGRVLFELSDIFVEAVFSLVVSLDAVLVGSFITTVLFKFSFSAFLMVNPP